MSPLAPLAVALLGAAASAQAGDELVVRSQGGLFEARLAKAPGQERVADALARWRLEVRDGDGRELWSSLVPGPDPAQRLLLSEDGAVFVRLDPRFRDSRPVALLQAGDGPARQVFGGDLDLPREALRAAQPPGAWLVEGEAAARFGWVLGPGGPQQVLELACVDGVTRSIDLASGVPVAAGGGAVPVWVEPAHVEDEDVVPAPRVPPVESFSAPASARGGEALVVHLAGKHPNPGWRIHGFTLEPGPEPGSLVVTPYARPPLPPGLTLQQIEPYAAEARVFGLPPGEHRVYVKGAGGLLPNPSLVSVSPGGMLARLRTRGGILGLDETLTLYENGVVQVESSRAQRERLAFAPPRAFAEARAWLSRLPPLEPPASVGGADFFDYTLTWRVSGEWRTLAADDGNARGELRQTLDAVRRLAASD